MVSTPFQQESTAQKERYEQMRDRVAGFTDALGKTVDPGIFETVIYFNLFGIQTWQSCEGHLDHGHPYPWITLIDDERSRQFNRIWRHVCSLEEQARTSRTAETFEQYLAAESNLRILVAGWESQDACFTHIISLLESFYADRETNAARLIVKRLQPGMYRLEPGFSRVAAEIPAEIKAGYLERGQAEMRALTSYLQQRFFA